MLLVVVCLLPAFVLGQASLFIGRQRAVVLETRLLDLQRGTNVVELTLPYECDVPTLVLRHEHGMVEWLGAEIDSRGRPPPRSFEVSFKDDKQLPALAPAEVRLSCRLYSRQHGRVPVQLVYMISGICWRAEYQIIVHGDWDTAPELLSADLTGWALIDNGTGYACTNASVWLASGPPPFPHPEPGWLILEPQPLARPWQPQYPEYLPAPARKLGSGLTVAARARQAYPLIEAQRIPAEVIYELKTPPALPGIRPEPVPAQRYLAIRGLAQAGKDLPLPEGPVNLYRGGTASAPVATGMLAIVRGSDELRLQLGNAPAVTAAKQEVSREEVEPGQYKISCRIVVHNAGPHEALVELYDIPAEGGWEMFSYAHAYERRGSQALFTLRLPAREERILRYTILTQKPVPAAVPPLEIRRDDAP